MIYQYLMETKYAMITWVLDTVHIPDKLYGRVFNIATTVSFSIFFGYKYLA